MRLAAEGGGGRKGGPHDGAIVEGLVAAIEGRQRPGEGDQGGDVAGNGIVGEETAHQVVLVADAGADHIVGGQHQPRILHRAGRQHRHARLHREMLAVQGRDIQVIHAGAVGGQADAGDIGMDIRRDVFCRPQVIAIAMAELGGQHTVAGLGELKPAGVEAALSQRQNRALGAGHDIALLVVDPGARLHQRLGAGDNRARAPRGRKASRNAASRAWLRNRSHPSGGTSRPSDWCRRPARASGPRPAAHSRTPVSRARIHLLDLGIETGAARFQQGDGDLAVPQGQGEGNAGRACRRQWQGPASAPGHWESCGRQSRRSKRQGPGKRGQSIAPTGKLSCPNCVGRQISSAWPALKPPSTAMA